MSIDLDAIRARLARVAGKWPTKGVLAPGADEFGPKAWSAHGPLRCHSTEKGRDRQWSQACADTDFLIAAPADIAVLLAEVERLRAERAAERAAVVACLRDRAQHMRADHGACDACWAEIALTDAACSIERGDHRREGEK